MQNTSSHFCSGIEASDRSISSRQPSTSKVSPPSIESSMPTKSKDPRPMTEGESASSNVVEEKMTRPKRLASSIPDDSCPVCSVVNQQMALTCVVCSNVLKPDFVPGSWRCKSSTCIDGEYINAGDVGLCGVCGARKCSDNSIWLMGLGVCGN